MIVNQAVNSEVWNIPQRPQQCYIYKLFRTFRTFQYILNSQYPSIELPDKQSANMSKFMLQIKDVRLINNSPKNSWTYNIITL